MNTQLLFGVAVVPAIIGLVQVSKDLGAPTRISPALAVAFGILAGLAELYAGQWPWAQAVVLGISLGLSACGLYSGARTVIARAAPTSTDTTTHIIRDITDIASELTHTPVQPTAAPPTDPTASTPTDGRTGG